jgi:hypothetical protein
MSSIMELTSLTLDITLATASQTSATAVHETRLVVHTVSGQCLDAEAASHAVHILDMT